MPNMKTFTWYLQKQTKRENTSINILHSGIEFVSPSQDELEAIQHLLFSMVEWQGFFYCPRVICNNQLTRNRGSTFLRFYCQEDVAP